MILCKFTTLLLFSVDDLCTVETLILSKVKITDSEITDLVNSEFFPLNLPWKQCKTQLLPPGLDRNCLDNTKTRSLFMALLVFSLYFFIIRLFQSHEDWICVLLYFICLTDESDHLLEWWTPEGWSCSQAGRRPRHRRCPPSTAPAVPRWEREWPGDKWSGRLYTASPEPILQTLAGWSVHLQQPDLYLYLLIIFNV